MSGENSERPQHPSQPNTQLTESPRPLPPEKKFWIAEIWDENRESFKEIFYDVLLFIIVIITVSLIGYLIHIAPLPEPFKIILEILDIVGGILLLFRPAWRRYSSVRADTRRDAIKREAEKQLFEKMKRVFERETGIVGDEVEQVALEELQRIKKELRKE